MGTARCSKNMGTARQVIDVPKAWAIRQVLSVAADCNTMEAWKAGIYVDASAAM